MPAFEHKDFEPEGLEAFLNTPAVQDILGRLNFSHGQIAEAFRLRGVPIERKYEAEQAWFLTKALMLAASHGNLWQDALQAEYIALGKRGPGGK